MLAGLLGTVRCVDTRGRAFARGCSCAPAAVCLWSLLGCWWPSSPACPARCLSSDELRPSTPSADTQSAFLPPATKGLARPGHSRHFCRDARGTPVSAAPAGALAPACRVCPRPRQRGQAGRTAPPSWPTLQCDRSDSWCAGAPSGGLTSAQVVVLLGPPGVSCRQRVPCGPPPTHTPPRTLGGEHWS